MNDKHIIQVAPLFRLPILKTQVFSYLSEKPIETGSLVRIPFYRRNIEGIVVSSKKDFPRKGNLVLKKISSVVVEKMLSAWQIDFAQKLSEYYLSSLGTFLNLMVPKNTSKISRKSRSKETPSHGKSLSRGVKKTLVIGSASERLNFNLPHILKVLKRKKQCLIIVPEIYFAYELQNRLSEEFPGEEIPLFHGKLPKGKFYDWWEKIRDGKIRLVVATKLGVFLPYSALELVIIEEEQDVSHKQWDMNPRYNAVRAAEFLAETHSAEIFLGSSNPSAENFWRAETEKWRKVVFGTENKFRAEAKIINLFKEKKSADFPISKELCEEMSRALTKKKKILLIAKRRGYSTFSVCQGCKNILKCPECGRALPYFEESSKYKCLHCSFFLDLFTACPKCGNHQFSHFGVGTQLVERRLKILFPSAKIARLDIDSVKTPKKYEELSRKVKSGKIDIVVGTQIALKPGNFWNFDLVGIVSAHDFFSFPDFNSRELALSSFIEARNIAEKGGKFIVQTFSPNEPIFEFLNPQKQLDFFENELALRKRLSFPPFSRMLKLSYKNESSKKTEKETQSAFDLLQTTGNNEIEVSDPYEPIALKKRGNFRKNILVKADPRICLRELPLYAVVGGFKKGWTIDVDPISTI